ncbi:MAG: hypothetical protein KatS3mg022_3050 [Armatimonadota bacterium]|nr:MAG: hypothetical protein KatS3mg022_3050 [Armatimonadota bacterium]GIV22196.1 MAG: hypothetical protein KatS3mg023_3947 [Armatimonadota bacterium]
MAGILLLTHRYLDPTTGRFLTRDPIGIEGGINLYAYCRNRVVMLNDRSGTIGFFPVVCSACAVCLAGFALSCYDCGLDASCWMNCVSNIWQNLPTWVKILCGGACIGCGVHIILPGPKPDPHPVPLPNPREPVKPEPDCPDGDGHRPVLNRYLCTKYCRNQCAYWRDIEWETYKRCFEQCMMDCLIKGILPDACPPVAPVPLYQK